MDQKERVQEIFLKLKVTIGGRRVTKKEQKNQPRKQTLLGIHVVTHNALIQYPPSTSGASLAAGGSAASMLEQTSSAVSALSDQRKTLFLWVEDLGESPARLISLTISFPLLLCPY